MTQYMTPLPSSARKSSPMLGKEEERELAICALGGDRAAGDKLVLYFQPRVKRMAHKYAVHCKGDRHENFGELYQAGMIGLLRARPRFRPELGFRFATYASWWIRSEMQEYAMRNWSIVRTGTTAAQKLLFFKLRHLRAKYDDGLGDWLSDESCESIAHELGVRVSDVKDMEKRLNGGDQSLNALVGDEGGDDLLDFLADDGPNPEDQVREIYDRHTYTVWLAEAMGELSERESTIIQERRLREDPATLQMLGVSFGISKERVRQIEQKALGKMRAYARKHNPEHLKIT